jgi:hypothetical protein
LGSWPGSFVTGFGTLHGNLVASCANGPSTLFQWDGATWREVGTSVTEPISGLASDDETVYFLSGSDVLGSRVFRTTGAAPGELLPPLGPGAVTLCAFDGTVVAGGSFVVVEEDTVRGIAIWRD